MPPKHQGMRGYKGRKSQKKPHFDNQHPSELQPVAATVAESDINRFRELTIAEKNEQTHVPPSHHKHGSFMPDSASKRAVWKPKSDGSVNHAMIVENEAGGAALEKSGLGSSKLSKCSLLEDSTNVNPTCSQSQKEASFYPKRESEKLDKEGRGGYREHRWQKKPNSVYMGASEFQTVPATVAECDNNRVGELTIAEKNERAHVSPLLLKHQSILQNSASKHCQRAVWKLKSDGLVNAPKMDEVENLADQAVDCEGNGAGIAALEKSVQGFSKSLNTSLVENSTTAKATYSHAQIKAAFYPKVEDGKSNQEIRMRMIEMVSEGLGTLEVSLKHSGFLFMYAGEKGGAYAKSSFGNIYTAVGVFVLGRIFNEAWGTEAREKQAEFNCFLEKCRLCISVELVTAVLGDHGQRPQEDYGVVIAVTELDNGQPKFYSTPDIIAFCQKWRLPTNYVWLFSTRKSVTTFFAAYDALCEEGTATSVCKVFDEVADLSVPGSKDFMKVQGEVLEGLVARIVNHGTLMRTEKVLRDFHPQPFEVDLDLGPSLREICAANRSDEWQKIKALLHSTDDAFCLDYSDWFETEPSDEYTRKADQSVISKFLEAHPTDFCTAKLQEMIHLMKEKHYCVKLQCYHNFSKMVSLSNDRVYVKMTIDAYSDSAFRRYEQEMRCGPGLWPLYQGLFFEVSIFKATRDRAVDIAESGSNSVPNICDGGDTSEKDNLAVEDANLRIKLKFLPYRLRTSLIRNGLSVLFMEGRAAYRAYYLRQMKSWGISSEKQWATSKMLDEWSFYVRKKYDPRQLSPSIYLSEVEPFLEQYAKRSQENKSLVGSAGNSVTDEDFLAIEDGTEFGSAGNLARSEDFLAEDGTDGEGDFANHLKPAFSTSASLVGNKSPKNEGLIIFFPGMPGSTKSGICREINAKDGLGDGRRVHWLMGNHIKGIGRNYWQELADECRRKPHSVILADKNAPNEDAWRQIERICRKTKSSAVPVVTDSEGTNSNPFCLDTLAVHMFHVHQRDYHTGNLDKASPKAGYVLLLFYHLNEGKSRKEFERDLVERFGSLVRVPLLKSDRSPIPDPIRSTLEEGISLFKLHRQKHPCLESLEGSYSKDWAMWEEKMQNIILENSAYLDYIQVPFEDRVKQVLEQLRTIATGESAALSTERRKFGTIAFAAVSLPLADIQSLLDSLAENNPGVEAFLKGKDTEKSFMKTYITLAHKKCHGVVAVANYGPLLYQKVPVDLTALFFSGKVAAFEASLGSADGEKIISKDQWPHVTIWTGRVPEEEVNLLPQLVSEDKATRININPPTGMLGTLEFY